MPDPNAGLPPRYLRTPEAARFLGLSGRTLEKHRTYGTGPNYSKIGGRVVYAVEDLQVWLPLPRSASRRPWFRAAPRSAAKGDVAFRRRWATLSRYDVIFKERV